MLVSNSILSVSSRAEKILAGHPVKSSDDPEHFFSDDDVVSPIGPSPQLASFATKLDVYSVLSGVATIVATATMGYILY